MILVDQIGYLTNYNKIAMSTSPCNYQLIDANTHKTVLDGVASEIIDDESSMDKICKIDFSEITTPGEYYLLAGNGEKSSTFIIGDDIYSKLQYDLSKCLYYQRCGCGLESKHAGIYARPKCHTEDAILLEDYLSQNKDAVKYEMKGGWHDAGDFGRYASAGAVAVAHILYAYELFPDSFNYSMNIPESGNGIPDILNECYYELSWLLKMQAPDGGVYHKLTAWKHADFIMPDEDHDQFIIYPVSSVATGDFAAVMSLASRIYKPFMPEFASKALEASKKAGEWLRTNPNTMFKNPKGSNTGEYGDSIDLDERLWAAVELSRMDVANRTLHCKYLTRLIDEELSFTDFGWTDVSGFASLSILTDPQNSFGVLRDKFKHYVLSVVCSLEEVMETSGYNLAMKPGDFVWGSNMVVLNRAMPFALGSIITEGITSAKHKESVAEHIHYILGRNAVDISYVTGFGEKAYKNPHNRVTDKDGIDEPMPGWVSGGPFRNFCDAAALEKIKKGTAPMKCYCDHVGSYSTNEITIYWNSPMIFAIAFLRSNL